MVGRRIDAVAHEPFLHSLDDGNAAGDRSFKVNGHAVFLRQLEQAFGIFCLGDVTLRCEYRPKQCIIFRIVGVSFNSAKRGYAGLNVFGGADNAYVITELLGHSSEELERWERDQKAKGLAPSSKSEAAAVATSLASPPWW